MGELPLSRTFKKWLRRCIEDTIHINSWRTGILNLFSQQRDFRFLITTPCLLSKDIFEIVFVHVPMISGGK